MPRTKISKVARALNIGLQTAVDFLDKKGISVDTNPNTKIDESAVMLLVKEYAPSADAKATTADIMAGPARQAEQPAAPQAPAAAPAAAAQPVRSLSVISGHPANSRLSGRERPD